MQRLIKFKLNRDCREIAVNPDKVLWVCHYENGASALHFAKDCYVKVEGDLDEVVRRLESVMTDCGDPPGSTASGDAVMANVN